MVVRAVEPCGHYAAQVRRARVASELPATFGYAPGPRKIGNPLFLANP
jgi:hypothetical protein